MGTKGWIIFGVITAAVLGALIYFSGQNRVDVSQYASNHIIGANEDNGNIADHTKGLSDSKVVFIEYGDYQCPGCAGAASRIQSIVEKYDDKITFIFRNLPISSMHPHARAAAAAAEAAAMQDKYWEMHYLLFEQQNEWASASASDRMGVFETYAQSLGLDLDTFRTDYAKESITQKVNFDLALAKEKGYQATPTFELNGEELDEDTWGNDDALEAAIQKALADAGVSIDDIDSDEE